MALEALKQIFFLLPGSDTLFVAHTRNDLNSKRISLDSLYLNPIQRKIVANNGFVYPDRKRTLQLLVDIKTEAIPTLNRLIEVLQKFPQLTTTHSLKIVISGNRPSPDSFHLYPTYILFDGVIGSAYSHEAMKKIPLFSANFSQFSRWMGNGTLPAEEKSRIVAAIRDVHKKKKPVRFWGAPDTEDAWKELMKIDADFINTDKIKTLSMFLRDKKYKVGSKK